MGTGFGIGCGVQHRERGPTLSTMSTRMLIILSLLCGMALLVAFTVQVLIAR